jgi:hypothetical protein
VEVRPGYKPPEDVELYKNRAAAAWKNRGKGGVPGAENRSPVWALVVMPDLATLEAMVWCGGSNLSNEIVK